MLALRLRRLESDSRSQESGASAVEYALLVTAVAAIIVLVTFALGSFVKGSFADTCDAVSRPGHINSAGTANNDCNQ